MFATTSVSANLNASCYANCNDCPGPLAIAYDDDDDDDANLHCIVCSKVGLQL